MDLLKDLKQTARKASKCFIGSINDIIDLKIYGKTTLRKYINVIEEELIDAAQEIREHETQLEDAQEMANSIICDHQNRIQTLENEAEGLNRSLDQCCDDPTCKMAKIMEKNLDRLSDKLSGSPCCTEPIELHEIDCCGMRHSYEMCCDFGTEPSVTLVFEVQQPEPTDEEMIEKGRAESGCFPENCGIDPIRLEAHSHITLRNYIEKLEKGMIEVFDHLHKEEEVSKGIISGLENERDEALTHANYLEDLAIHWSEKFRKAKKKLKKRKKAGFELMRSQIRSALTKTVTFNCPEEKNDFVNDIMDKLR